MSRRPELRFGPAIHVTDFYFYSEEINQPFFVWGVCDLCRKSGLAYFPDGRDQTPGYEEDGPSYARCSCGRDSMLFSSVAMMAN